MFSLNTWRIRLCIMMRRLIKHGSAPLLCIYPPYLTDGVLTSKLWFFYFVKMKQYWFQMTMMTLVVSWLSVVSWPLWWCCWWSFTPTRSVFARGEPERSLMVLQARPDPNWEILSQELSTFRTSFEGRCFMHSWNFHIALKRKTR